MYTATLNGQKVTPANGRDTLETYVQILSQSDPTYPNLHVQVKIEETKEIVRARLGDLHIFTSSCYGK